jgi:hypothetical protein
MPSMGSVGDAYDNAIAESFFATLERELLSRRRFRSQAEAKMAGFEWIEGWYNPYRRHSGSHTYLPSTTSARTSAHRKSEGRSFCRPRRQAALRCKIEEVRPETKSEDEKLSTETGQVQSLAMRIIRLAPVPLTQRVGASEVHLAAHAVTLPVDASDP